jgi:hypothetical protein
LAYCIKLTKSRTLNPKLIEARKGYNKKVGKHDMIMDGVVSRAGRCHLCGGVIQLQCRKWHIAGYQGSLKGKHPWYPCCIEHFSLQMAI